MFCSFFSSYLRCLGTVLLNISLVQLVSLLLNFFFPLCRGFEFSWLFLGSCLPVFRARVYGRSAFHSQLLKYQRLYSPFPVMYFPVVTCMITEELRYYTAQLLIISTILDKQGAPTQGVQDNEIVTPSTYVSHLHRGQRPPQRRFFPAQELQHLYVMSLGGLRCCCCCCCCSC